MWNECPFYDTLRNGFKKTGLFPFGPEVILGTTISAGRCDEIASLPVQSFSPQKRKLREVMEEMNVPDQSIDSVISQTVRLARGHTAGYEIAHSLHQALLEASPPKKRRTKDHSFSTESGLILTSPPAIAAVTDQEERKKTPAKKKSTAKKPPVQPKKPRQTVKPTVMDSRVTRSTAKKT